MTILIIFLIIFIWLILAFVFLFWREHQKLAKKYQEIVKLQQKLTEYEDILNLQAQGKLADKNYPSLSEEIVRLAPQCLVCFDKNWLVTLWNMQAEKITGIAATYAVGKSFTDIVTLNEADKTQIEATFNGKVVKLENTLFKLQNKTIPVKGMVLPLKSDQEAALFFQDYSEETEKEQEVKTFFSAAIHDLRTPLAIIRSCLEQIQTSSPNSAVNHPDYLQMAQIAGAQLNQLITDVLNVTRLELGRTEVNKKQVDIGDLVKQIMNTHQSLVKEKRLYLNLEDGTQVPKIITDQPKVTEIITNLVSNAIKYTFQGGITLRLSVEENKICIRIIDTGMGISDEYKRLLFQKFHQLGTIRGTNADKSTGLGLYIAREFARLLGGDVILEKSAPGQGSTFLLTLPL